MLSETRKTFERFVIWAGMSWSSGSAGLGMRPWQRESSVSFWQLADLVRLTVVWLKGTGRLPVRRPGVGLGQRSCLS